MAITEVYETRIVSSIAGSKVHYRFCWSLLRDVGVPVFTQAKALGDAIGVGTVWNDALLNAHTFHQEFLYVKTRRFFNSEPRAGYAYRFPLNTHGTILDLVGTTWECATVEWVTNTPLNTKGTWGLRGVVNGGLVNGAPGSFLRSVITTFANIHLAGLTLSTGNTALPAIIHVDQTWTIVEDWQFSPRAGRKTAHQEVN